MDALDFPKESYKSDTKSSRERKMRGIQVFSFLGTCPCARQLATLFLMRVSYEVSYGVSYEGPDAMHNNAIGSRQMAAGWHMPVNMKIKSISGEGQ